MGAYQRRSKHRKLVCTQLQSLLRSSAGNPLAYTTLYTCKGRVIAHTFCLDASAGRQSAALSKIEAESRTDFLGLVARRLAGYQDTSHH